MEIPVDFLGNELNIGDRVVFMNVNYRDLNKGKILKLGDKKATIEYILDNRPETKKTWQFYDQLVKIKE